MDGEVLEGEEVRHTPFIRGSRTSRKASPPRLNERTVAMMAMPGKTKIHHSPETMYPAPSAVIAPHSLVGGRMPRPIYESAATVRIAKPMPSVAWTMPAGHHLGSTGRQTIHRCRLPPRP